jgi:hypothetical protein
MRTTINENRSQIALAPTRFCCVRHFFAQTTLGLGGTRALDDG